MISRKEEYYQNEDPLKEGGDVGRKMSKYRTEHKKTCTTLEIVNAFRDLCYQPFHAAAHKWLKSKQATKLEGNPFTFAPTVNERSKKLDKRRIERHIPQADGKAVHKCSLCGRLRPENSSRREKL